MSHDRAHLVHSTLDPWVRCLACGFSRVSEYAHYDWRGRLKLVRVVCTTAGCGNAMVRVPPVKSS